MTNNQAYRGRVAELRQRGILPSREEMMKISAAIDTGMQREAQMEHDFSYYRPGEKQPVARNLTEADWKGLGQLINCAEAI